MQAPASRESADRYEPPQVGVRLRREDAFWDEKVNLGPAASITADSK